MTAAQNFAPAVLRIYHRGKEEFWETAMAPFLSDNPLTLIKHHKVGLGLMGLFRDMDKYSMDFLRRQFQENSTDVTKWDSLQSKREYFKDSWPVYAFLAIWMDEHDADKPLEGFSDILDAVICGIAGYGIQDVLVDGADFKPLEMLASQALVAEYETRILRAFSVCEANLAHLHRVRSQFLQAELKEKSLRYQQSPYRADFPEECGFKAAHLLTPFMLCLEAVGKLNAAETYNDVFMKFGAVIQILDDFKDLEDDLSIGHYSYITLGSDAVERLRGGESCAAVAASLRRDKPRLLHIYSLCSDLLAQSQALLATLNEPLIARIVEVTGLRLNAYYRKELDITI